MKTMTSTLAKLVSLTSLLTAMACSGADPTSGTSQPLVGGEQGECAEDSEDGPNDKILCSEDVDCDSDEFCLNGRCTGYDGDVEDETADGCDAEDEDDAADAEEDDEEEEDDKIVCSVNADCDSDEVCTNGLCE